MAGTLKDKAEEVGHKIAESTTKLGNRIGEKTEAVADWAKEKAHEAGHRLEEAGQKVEHKSKETFGSAAKTTADIREHMDVFGACGDKIGKVDHVEGSSIKLTKHDSADGMHHLIPMSWVDRVHDHIHLTKTCEEVKSEWKTV